MPPLIEWSSIPGIFLHKYWLGWLPKSLSGRSSWHQDRGFVNIETSAWWVFWAPVRWNGKCEWYQDVEAFEVHKALRVPDPEKSFTAPLLLVDDEESLEADVCDAWEAPENDPGHRLLEGEHVSTVSPDAAHPSQWTMVAHEPALLKTTMLHQDA